MKSMWVRRLVFNALLVALALAIFAFAVNHSSAPNNDGLLSTVAWLVSSVLVLISLRPLILTLIASPVLWRTDTTEQDGRVSSTRTSWTWNPRSQIVVFDSGDAVARTYGWIFRGADPNERRRALIYRLGDKWVVFAGAGIAGPQASRVLAGRQREKALGTVV